jgi:hypothetical protein
MQILHEKDDQWGNASRKHVAQHIIKRNIYQDNDLPP